MNTACLVLHGFCGSPFEVMPLRKPLETLGYDVFTPTLPGHNTSIEDLKHYFFPDWVAFAHKEFQKLRQEYKRVIVIGFSMGGTLALHTAASFKPDALITLSAPCYLYRLIPWEVRAIQLLFLPLLAKLKPYPAHRLASAESKAIAPFEGYEGTLCLPQIVSLQKGYKQLRPLLQSITCPTLLMHDLQDRLVPPSNALTIARKIRSSAKRLVYVSSNERITNHHHIVTHRQTSPLVIDEVTRFLQGLFA